MGKTFELAQKFVAKWEGGVSDHPDDRGGVTAYGVSLAYLAGLSGAATGRNLIQNLGLPLPVSRETVLAVTPAIAAALFRHSFWDRTKIGKLSPRLALATYDCAVNMGPGAAIKLLQKGIRLAGPKIAADGIIGQETLKAQAGLEAEILGHALALREDRYRNICASNPSQKVFLKGWLNRTADLRRYITKHLEELG